MKLLYVTDCHGIKWKYNRFIEIIESLKPDIVINGGDMLPFGNFLNQDEFILEFLDGYFSKLNSKRINFLSMLG
ncbi:MAG: metallophosphoesterase, partial [Candidatus Hermodarchaeota archaeon]